MSCIENFRPSTIPLKTCTEAISCPVLLLIYKRRFCIAAFREAYHPVCSIDYDHCSHLYRPTSSPSPHRGINDDQSPRASFCYGEVKRVSQYINIVNISISQYILLRGWNAYGSSAGSPKKMTLVNVTHLILKWGDSRLKLLSFEIFVALGQVEANFLPFHILSALFCCFEKSNTSDDEVKKKKLWRFYHWQTFPAAVNNSGMSFYIVGVEFFLAFFTF